MPRSWSAEVHGADPLARRDHAFLHGRSSLRRQSRRCCLSKAFVWAAGVGLLPEGKNPVKNIKKYREQGRERFLTSEELARLGDALREGETVGLPYSVDETKATAKHAAKADHRRVKLDPYAVAALRLLLLTGARLREILHPKWVQIDLERGLNFLADSKSRQEALYLSAAAQKVLRDVLRVAGNPHVIAGAKDGAPRADSRSHGLL